MPIAGIGGTEFPKIGTIRKGAPKESGPLNKRDLGPVFRVIFNGTDERTIEAQERFITAYGSLQPEEIDAIFTVDLPEEGNTWRFWLEAYDKGALVLQTDGEWIQYQRNRKTGQAVVRNGRDVETGERVPYDGQPAYSYYSKKNKVDVPVYPKAHGYLRIIVPALRRLAYLELRTTSFWDCDNIDKNLHAIASTHGGLKGIPCIIRRRLTPVSKPLGSGKRFWDDEWLVYVEAAPEWVDDKLAQLEAGAFSPTYQITNGNEPPAEPVDAEAEIVDDAPAAAEPETTSNSEAPKANGRPLAPADLRRLLHKKAATYDAGPATAKQIPFVARKFAEAFAPAEDATDRYHMTLSWLWSTNMETIDSATKLTFAQAGATLDWLLAKGGADTSGDTPLHKHAPAEAAGVYKAALTEQGQMEMSMEAANTEAANQEAANRALSNMEATE